MTTTPVPIGRMMLNDVRLYFYGENLYKASAFKDGEPKFKVKLLVPKGSPTADAVDARILAVMAASPHAKGKAAQVIAQIKSNPNKFCWQDGDAATYEGYAGYMTLSAASKTLPTLLDQQRNKLGGDTRLFYSGCHVNASVDIFAYNNTGLGISSTIRGVQFVREGDSFSAGRPADADEFEEVTEGAGAEEFF